MMSPGVSGVALLKSRTRSARWSASQASPATLESASEPKRPCGKARRSTGCWSPTFQMLSGPRRRDGQCVFITPNVAKVCGCTPEELYGSIQAFRSPESIRNTRKECARDTVYSSRPAGCSLAEYRVQKKDGAWVWLRLKAVAAMRKRGETLHGRHRVGHHDAQTGRGRIRNCQASRGGCKQGQERLWQT